MNDAYVQTRSLTKRYGSLVALDDCGLEIRRGEVFGLLGPNGSGKTTLLRLLMGFLRPSAGEATIDGLDCYHESLAVHRKVAYLPGDAKLFPQTVRSEILALVCEARSAGRTVIFSSHVLDEVEQVCDRVGILRHGRLVYLQLMAELRRQHRIRATLTAPLPMVPAAVAGQLEIAVDDDQLTVLTPGELSPLLGWLATLPMTKIRIEPVGLRAVYDRYHASTNGDRA